MTNKEDKADQVLTLLAHIDVESVAAVVSAKINPERIAEQYLDTFADTHDPDIVRAVVAKRCSDVQTILTTV